MRLVWLSQKYMKNSCFLLHLSVLRTRRPESGPVRETVVAPDGGQAGRQRVALTSELCLDIFMLQL